MPVIIENNVQQIPVNLSGAGPVTLLAAPSGTGLATQWIRIPSIFLSSQSTGTATLSSNGVTITQFSFPGVFTLNFNLNGALAGQPASSLVLAGFSGAVIVGNILALYQNIIRSAMAGNTGTPVGGLLLSLTNP